MADQLTTRPYAAAFCPGLPFVGPRCCPRSGPRSTGRSTIAARRIGSGRLSSGRRGHIMAVTIVAIHRMRDELRAKLLVDLDLGYRMAAGNISGPGLALDFGHTG